MHTKNTHILIYKSITHFIVKKNTFSKKKQTNIEIDKKKIESLYSIYFSYYLFALHNIDFL